MVKITNVTEGTVTSLAFMALPEVVIGGPPLTV